MAFDIACLDTYTRSQSGTDMTVTNPRSNAPMLRDDGSPVTITLHGRASDQYREKQREIQQGRADRAARGIATNSDEIAQEDVAILIACTVTWNIDEMDGKPFPASPDNIRLLWSDHRFMGLRDRAIRHILDDGNFLPVSSAA